MFKQKTATTPLQSESQFAVPIVINANLELSALQGSPQ